MNEQMAGTAGSDWAVTLQEEEAGHFAGCERHHQTVQDDLALGATQFGKDNAAQGAGRKAGHGPQGNDSESLDSAVSAANF